MAESNRPWGGESLTPALLSQLCLGFAGLGKPIPLSGPQFPQRCNDILDLSGSPMLACTRAMWRAVNTGRWAQRRASEPAGLGDATRVLVRPALGPHSEDL